MSNLALLNKFILLLLFSLSTSLYSQEIDSKYAFYKEGKCGEFKCQEVDSLSLYKDKTYHRSYKFVGHEIVTYQETGIWNIDNGILFLFSYYENKEGKEKETEFLNRYFFKMKKNSIVLLNRYECSSEGDRKLFYNIKLKRVKE